MAMNTTKFGEKLIAQRKKMHLTQEQLAEKMNVSRQAISRWENENLIPDGENLIKLREILKISIDALVSDEPIEDFKAVDENKKGNRAGKIAIGLILIGVFGLLIIFILSTQIEVTVMKPLISSGEGQINSEEIIPNQTLYTPTQVTSFFPFLDYYNLEIVAIGFLLMILLGAFLYFYSKKK
jgi:transcriptional regulator with XRE-family HTH domain